MHDMCVRREVPSEDVADAVPNLRLMVYYSVYLSFACFWSFVQAVDTCVTGRGLCLGTDHWRDVLYRTADCITTKVMVFHFFIYCLSHFKTPPLSRGESVISRDQPISPWCTPCILVLRIGSALPRRASTHDKQTQLATLFTLTI